MCCTINPTLNSIYAKIHLGCFTSIDITVSLILAQLKLKYRIFSILIRTSFCRFLKRKKKLVRGSNPHLSFNRTLRAAPSEVARWVSDAWKAIPESIIVGSFKKRCISDALDGSEDDSLWEDDGEDKYDCDWMTDNDSVTTDGGESEE
jgi:hypothetical protein